MILIFSVPCVAKPELWCKFHPAVTRPSADSVLYTTYVFITSFHEFWIFYLLLFVKKLAFRQKITIILILKEMAFCYRNCSDLLWEKIVLVIEKNFWNSRLKAEIIRIIYSNSERSEQVLVTKCFFNLFLEVSHI